MIENLKEKIGSISNLSEIEDIRNILNSLLTEVLQFNAQKLKLKDTLSPHSFSFLSFEQSFGVTLGVKRNNNEIILNKWLIDALKTRSTTYLMYFIIIKESLVHFFNEKLTETDEAILNIISILWIKHYFLIKTLDNPMIKAVNHRIYQEEDIAGKHYLQFDNISNILFIKNISFEKVFAKFYELKELQKLSENDLFQEFRKWAFSFISEFDVISPIVLSKRFLPTLELLTKLNHKDANAETIAEILKLHPNSIRKQFRSIFEKYIVTWRPIINSEQLKLHDYFLKVIIKNGNFNDIYNTISKIPYNKSVYVGESDTYKIIYCPSLICPHLVSEQLNAKLTKLMNKNEIVDFNIQQIRERFHFGTITHNPINPTIDYFQKILQNEKEIKELIPMTIAQERIENFSLEFDDEDKTVDYNLLYFLSILRSKYLLKQGYNVFVAELPHLYKINNIDVNDNLAGSVLLNRLEIRALKKGLLTYVFFIRSFAPRAPNVLIFEIPTLNKNYGKTLKDTIYQLQKFSFLAQITIADREIYIIPGLNHTHPISNLIKQVLDKNGLESLFYTIRLNESRFIPLHDLYDYNNQKWLV
ncbi:MAG: hypothetical protein JXA54_14935 [Candidatus Heimdallarchaeota archaeon]|nr:hypothetical protein [Candidatus Heimdallarchaeota archaeon]